MTQSSTGFRGPWIVLACFFTFGIASGFPFYNISFFFDYLVKDHGWTQQAVTLGGPIAVLLTIWTGPLIVPRFSPRWLIIIGTGLTCLAFHGFARVETTARLLRILVRLDVRVFPVGTARASGHPVELVQEEARPRDGHCVRWRRSVGNRW